MIQSQLVSILVPYYAHADFLPAAVDSALAQTYQNLEVIVVDDLGPSISAAEILRHCHDPRVRIISQEKNLGAAQSRNAAGANARGSLLLPLDSDDLLDTTYLEKTLPYLDDPQIGGVYTAIKSFGTKDDLYDTEWTMEGILTGKAGALVCMLYRKKIFDDLKGYDTRWRVGEDSDFFLRALKQGWRFARVAEPLYFYRRHDRATTASRPAGDLKELTRNLATYHRDLMTEHLETILQYKEDRFWNMFEEYQHLHSEFHKLLELYTNLEQGIRSQQEPGLVARLRARLSRTIRG